MERRSRGRSGAQRRAEAPSSCHADDIAPPGDAFVIHQDGCRRGTPMLVALILITTFDVVFALDSIPAIFAVTRETFIVYAANAFSLLGFASLYFVLVELMERFRHLNVVPRGGARLRWGEDDAH
jgi:predicted tellurium resistance membrane protein TerC